MMRWLPAEPVVVSGCFHCSEPGATPGQRLTVFGIAGVGACSGLLFLVSCALAEVTRVAAISQSAMKDFRCFLLIEFPPVTLSSENFRLPFPDTCFCLISPASGRRRY